MVKSRELSGSTANQDLTHGRCQMGNRSPVLPHPFSKSLVLNVFTSGHQQLSSQEQWGENVSLDRVVCDTTEHSKPLIGREIEVFSHPWEVVGQGEVTAPNTLWSSL